MGPESSLRHRLVHRRMRRHPIEEEELIDSDAERGAEWGVDGLDLPRAGNFDHGIQTTQPAQGPQNQLAQQAAIQRLQARLDSL